MFSLRIISGPLAGERIEITRVLTVGRADADVVIDDPDLSRRHLEIRTEGDVILVEDLGSTNGTLVDDVPIRTPTRVGDGTRLRFGTTVAEVEGEAAGEQATRIGVDAINPDLTRVRQTVPRVPTSTPDRSAPADAPRVALPEPSLVSAAQAPPGPFVLPSPRRGRGLASRTWVPVVLSFGTVIVTAIALVIYFAQR